MSKRYAICLGIVILLSMLFSFAAADLNISDNGSETTTVYIAITDDTAELTAARYVAEAIEARWPERTLRVYRLDNNDEIKKVEDVIKAKTSTRNKKNAEQKAIDALKDLTEQRCDLWIVVPESAFDQFKTNESIKSVLQNSSQASSMHIVFIGESIKEEEIKAFSADLPIDWIAIKKDFTVSNLEGNENSSIHTGDFFIASLYGNPLDLSVDPETYQFQMQENGRVLILAKGEETEKPVILDPQGNSKSAEAFSMKKSKGEVEFRGTYTKEFPLSAGQYTIQLNNTSELFIKAYWYPDYDSIQPFVQMAEEWERGEQAVVLKTEKLAGDPNNYVVEIKYAENEEEPVIQSMKYDEEQGLWRIVFSIGETVNKVSFTPSMSLSMKDGNRVWSWQGEENIKIIQTREVKAKDNALNERDIFYYMNQVGIFSGTWNEYFTFNSADNPILEVQIDDSAKDAGWDTSWNAQGFSVFYIPDENKEKLDCDVKLVCGENSHHIHMALQDADEIMKHAVVITYEPEQLETTVGADLHIIAAISAENAAQWKKAKEQLPGLPGPGDMKLKAVLTTNEEAELVVKTEELTEKENQSWSASCTIHLDDRLQAGTYQLTGTISNQEDANGGGSVQHITVINNPPYAVNENIASVQELSGIPGQYSPIDILAVLYPDKTLFDLFKDDETEIHSVHLIVEPASGITVDGDKVEVCDQIITSADEPVQIQVADTGDYTLTMTASDGVNESEPFEVKVSVKSSFIRKAIYAGIGLAGLLLLLIVILTIHHKRKPSFDTIKIKAYISGDNNAEHGSEMLEKSMAIPMARYEKKGINLATVMILARQPEVSSSVMEVLEDITLYPCRYDEVKMIFGKKAMSKIGRPSNQERIMKGNGTRFRVENTYVQIENKQ